MNKDITFKDNLKSRAATFFMRLVAKFSLRTNQAFGRSLGLLLNSLPNSVKDVSKINIGLCFPELNQTQQQELVRKAVVESAKASAEMAWLWHNPDQALAKVVEIKGAEPLREAIANNEPVVILAPHLGSFEVLNFWVSTQFELHVMYKPAKIEGVDQLMLKGREHFGARLYPTTPRGMVGLLRKLRKGGVITAILPDQVPDDGHGKFSTFYGVPAYTGTLGPRMVQQSKGRVFMGWAERLPNAEGYCLHFNEPNAAIYSDDLDESLLAMNQSIEKLIAQAPEQYMWSYKRFRRATEGHKNPYK